MLEAETKKLLEDGMKAMAAFNTEIQPKLKKLDSFDEGSFQKMTNDIATALEAQQALDAKRAAGEKALQESIEEIKAAVNRPGAGSAQNKDAEKKASDLFNEFLRKNSSTVYDFADYLEAKDKSLLPEIKALTVGVDSQGGFLVVPTLNTIIKTRQYETSPLRMLANVQTISTDALEIPVDNSAAAAGGWVAEQATRNESTAPTIGKVRIVAHEQYAQPYATQQILDDASINPEAWLGEKIADIITRTENTAFITGSGVGQPTGIMSYSSGTDVTLGQVQRVNAGSTTTYTYAGLVDLQSSLKEVYQANATFLTKRANFGLLMKVVDGQSRPIFNLTFDKNTGLANSIMGRPLMFADDVAAASSAALSMAYGDFKAAYTIVDRTGIRILRDPFTSKPYVKFYATKRTGGGVVNFEAYKVHVNS